MQRNTEMVRTVNVPETIDLVALFYRLMEKIMWIILAAVIGGGIMGFYSFKIAKPVYQATSKLYIIGSDTTISLSDFQIGSQVTADYTEVFKNWHVHETVEQRLGLDVKYSVMENSIKVTNPSGTHVLYITASNGDPLLAKEIADTYAEVAREFIAAKMDMREPNIFEEARLPITPVSPQKARNVLLGIMMGILLAAAIITVQFMTDDRIRTEEDITKGTGLNTLGLIPLEDTRKLGLPDEHKKQRKFGKKA